MSSCGRSWIYCVLWKRARVCRRYWLWMGKWEQRQNPRRYEVDILHLLSRFKKSSPLFSADAPFFGDALCTETRTKPGVKCKSRMKRVHVEKMLGNQIHSARQPAQPQQNRHTPHKADNISTSLRLSFQLITLTKAHLRMTPDAAVMHTNEDTQPSA
jgi:hypothetical protein